MVKRTKAAIRRQAAARATAKRAADKAIKAPSMPQITIALGHAARLVIAEERAAGRFQGPVHRIVEVAIERLRQSGHVISRVTASRISDATSSNDPITSSL